MNLLELSRLGAHHLRNRASEEIYLRTGLDTTVPVSIYGEVIERCNYKCRYCDYWRRPNYREEMSIAEWKAALVDLKGFIGHFHIEFSGGEPYSRTVLGNSWACHGAWQTPCATASQRLVSDRSGPIARRRSLQI